MNVIDSMKGYVMYHCIYVGIKSGIFSYIQSQNNFGIQARDIAKQLQLKKDYVQIWLNTANAFDIIKYENGFYSVKKEHIPFILDSTDVRYQGELICIFIDHLSNDMLKQPEYMRSGATYTFSDHEHEFVELISKRGSLRAKTFCNNFLITEASTENIFLKKSKIADIGCGSGSFLQELSITYSEPSYIGVDEDEKSIGIAKGIANEKLDFILGRIEDVEMIHGFDCIIMVLSLHEILSENRVEVLEKCFSRLNPGGRLLVMEFPYPEKPSEFSDSKYLMGTIDQYFEMTWGTKHIGWSDQRSMIEGVGYINISRKFLPDGIYMVISATKP